jgi:thiol-disulfide isomerase/thioredoxin
MHRTPAPTLPSAPLRVAATLAAVLLLALGASGCSGSDRSANAAAPLPDVALADLGSDDEATWPTGTPLVVNFWASWCAPCRKEMPAFQEVADELGDEVAIVGVTDEDDLTAAREAADASGVTYRLLVDVDQQLLTQLELSGLPATVFVDADGTIVGRHLGALTASQLRQQIEDLHGIS